ncbi:MAG: hypothetical protein HUU29_13840 [Planctomycetaceae bacterium]|nr:hypothetical protein [Planctomycetaceae bacterium]
MRHWLIGCAVLFASGLAAQGEWFPREVIAYVQIEGGADLIEFCDTDALAKAHPEFEPISKFAQKKIATLTRLEIALIDMTFAKAMNSKLPANYLGVITFANDLDLDALFQEFQNELQIPLPPKDQLPAEEYQGGTIYSMPPMLFFSVRGKSAFFASEASIVKDAIDASLGKKPADELLTANPRFQTWKSQATAAFGRLYGDMANVIKAYDDFAAANPGDREMDIFSASGDWAEWRKLEYIDVQLARGTIDCHINFSSLPGALKVIPDSSTLSTLQYLPAMTIGCISFSLGGNIAESWQKLVDWLYESQIKMWTSLPPDSPARKDPRDMFDNRWRTPEECFGMDDIVEDVAALGFKRAAMKLERDGVQTPWSGTVKELAKLVKDPLLTTTFFGFSPTTVSDLDPNDGEYTGTIVYVNGRGASGFLKLERHGAGLNMSSPAKQEPLNRDDGLPGVPASEFVAAVGDALAMAAGVSKEDFAAMIGTNFSVGMAVNPIGAIMGQRPFDDDDSWFVILEIRERDKLMKAFVNGLTLIPEAMPLLQKNDKGEFDLVPVYEKVDKYNDVKVYELSGKGEVGFAITKNMLFVAPPGLLAQFAEGNHDAEFAANTTRTANMLLGGSTVDLTSMKMADDSPMLRLAAPMHALPTGTSTTIATQITNIGISIRVAHRLHSISQIWEQFFGFFMGFSNDDGYRIRRAHEQACEVYNQRLADADPKNDVFPTIAESLAMIHKDNAEKFGEDYEDESNALQYFDGSIGDHWRFVPVTDPEKNSPQGIIALSTTAYMGKTLAVTHYGQTYMLNADYEKKLLEWLKAPGKTDPRELAIPQVAKINKVQAAIWLERWWIGRALPEVKERAAELYKGGVGSVHYFEKYGKVEVLAVTDQSGRIRISGYGHWAEFDSELGGITAASWDEE